MTESPDEVVDGGDAVSARAACEPRSTGPSDATGMVGDVAADVSVALESSEEEEEPMTLLTRSRDRSPSRESLGATKDEIARRTAAIPQGSLRVDWTRLDNGERRELVDLTRRLGELDKRQTRRWELLVERGTNHSGIFAELRTLDEIARVAKDTVRRLARRPLSSEEERGVFLEIAEDIHRENLWADDAALALLLFAAFASGRPLNRRSRFDVDEDGGTVLIVDRGAVIGGYFDEEGRFAHQARLLAHLVETSWFTLDKRGSGEWRIGLGSRARAAMARAA
jgi:hypothetical protein